MPFCLPLVNRLINTPDPLAELNDFDDPLQQSSRTPLTGNIGGPSSGGASSSAAAAGSSWTSRIPGEDRRAPTNTIDESVWETLRRDLLAVWSKMREVLYPRHLFGGTALESADGFRGAYAHLRGAGLSGAREELAGLAGRVMDPEALLTGNTMSAGVRDWDLWGPLIFCLLLSMLLSWQGKAEQTDIVFSGVFAIVWIGEAVVTLQIKLLGGNMYVSPPHPSLSLVSFLLRQILLSPVPYDLPHTQPASKDISFYIQTNRYVHSSFAQSVCIIGYTLFPIVIAALLSVLHLPKIARIPVYIVLVLWSLAAGVSILAGSGVVKNRVGLAVYPLFIFYVGLGLLCFMS